MSRLEIDFAPPGWRRGLYRVAPGTWLAAAAGIALCASAAYAGSAALERQQLRTAQLQRAQLRVQASLQPPPLVPATPITPAQATAVNGAILQLNLPWRDMHEALATATPPGVALLALEPDARRRLLKITAETKSSDTMVDYIAQLKQQPAFGGGVQLLRHEVDALDPGQPLRFELEAHWGTP